MSTLPDVDFRRIRAYGHPPNRADGFEELASILIRYGAVEWPEGTQFARFGAPDGGREGKGTLPNGDVWAWQAKYLFQFDADAASQIEKSFKRALGREPRLTRYIVTMPIDRPAGDTDGRVSAYTRWNEKVEEWQRIAAAEGLSVEFVFVGAHELLSTLTRPENDGRTRYWFDVSLLAQDRQCNQIDEVVAKVGRRYTPELTVGVQPVLDLQALGRAPEYTDRWRRILAELREARRWMWRAPKGEEQHFVAALEKAIASTTKLDAALESVIAASISTTELPDIPEARDASEQVQAIAQLLREHSLTPGGLYVDDAATLHTNVRGALDAISKAESLAQSTGTKSSNARELLVVGRPGVGKTHLLCDVAKQRVSDGRPTVLLLGQDFDLRALETQIPERAEIGSSVEELLAILNAAGEAAGCRAMLMIDALNESERPDRWRTALAALRLKVARLPNVALALSCRTEYLSSVVGETDIPQVEHIGFGESTEVAVRRFAGEYGLDVPSFPVLNPEFGNPLVLRLACEALKTLGADRFVLGSSGLSSICDAFVRAVDVRLSGANRCDYDVSLRLAEQAVAEISALGARNFERHEVAVITERLLPGRSWSNSLMKGLLDEALLIEVGLGKVAFGYQRVGDMARAAAIGSRPPAEIKAWFESLGNQTWMERGTLAALAVIVPEIHGIELFELQDKSQYEDVDNFIESLQFRNPDSITDRAIGAVVNLDESPQWGEHIRRQLIRIACIPQHPLNAKWLHSYLSRMDIAERDASWSIELLGVTDPDEGSPVLPILEWAWPPRPAPINANESELVCLLLGWLLTSSDRRVRDKATKGLVHVGGSNPEGLLLALEALLNVNDPYVVERVAAAACGIVLRRPPNDVVERLAQVLERFTTNGWPMHLLTRDYVKRVLESAKPGEVHQPRSDSAWPISATSGEEIQRLAGPPDYEYASTWYSIAEMGDFGRYVLQPALRRFDVSDRNGLEDSAQRWIFDRVRSLGWTPERFGRIDRFRAGRPDGPIERIGKKYQWIALYELLGILTDHLQLQPECGDKQSHPYTHPEQLIWRDIDPTVLIRDERNPGSAPPTTWFNPVEATFPASVVTTYPDDMGGVPDPIDLLLVQDGDGIEWVALATLRDWKQRHDPEVEALSPPRRDIWMQIRGYIVPLEGVDSVASWAQGRDWYGRWMPDFPDIANALFGAHPNDPQWAMGAGEIDEWNSRDGGDRPAEFEHPCVWYAGTGTNRDASATNETTGFLPTKALLELLDLEPGVDFVWRDAAGAIAVWDPGAWEGGENVLLLRRDLMQLLRDAGFALFWTALVGHEHSNGGFGLPDDDYSWISASASYLDRGDGVELVSAIARRFERGPAKVADVDWTLRPKG